MKRMNGFLWVLCSLIVLNMACAKKEEESAEAALCQIGAVGVACSNDVLNGSWAGDCTSDGGSGYARQVFVFADDLANMEMRSYADASCTTLVSVLAYRFDTKGGDSVSNPLGAKTIDFLSYGVTITPGSAMMATSFNLSSFCGITDWADGVSKDVEGKNCGGTTMTKAPSLYTIYKMIQNDVWFGAQGGATDDGTTAEKRHTILGQTVFSKIVE